MTDYLFQEPISNFTAEKVGEARSQAERLSPEDLLSPDLGEKLQQLAKVKFDVAILKPEERKGKRRTEKQPRSDFGRKIIVNVDFIDVAIPFEGWPKSFHISPSTCNLIDMPAATSNGAIIVSFLDDQNLDRNVDSFIKQVSQNLEYLKKDLPRIETQRLQIMQHIANHRLMQIEERKERDKTRSFPIE